MVNLTDPPTPSAEAITDLRITALERQAAGHAAWLQLAEEQNLALSAELAELREEMRATREAIKAANEREILVSLIHEHGYHQAVQDFRPQVGGRSRRRAGRLVPRPSHIRLVGGTS